ncbi:MAG: hypothetical protein AB7E49_09470 [Campylobacterales bacterium]
MRALILTVFILLSSLLAQNTYQLPLQSGVWHLVGINGFHHRMPLPQSFESGGAWVQIRETPDSAYAFTWDYVDATTKNNHTTPNVGDETYSTLGLRLTPGNDSGVSEVIINYEQTVKDTDYPMLTMFVSSQGEGRRADVEIRFQSDYKDQTFYIKFDSSLVMEGVFDPRFTSDSPAVLKPLKSDATTVKKIADLIDTNLSDNNLTALDLINVDCETLYCVSEGVVTGGRQKLGEANVTAYHWSSANQVWAVYASRNAESFNDFNEFQAGKAYWVRIDAPATGDEAGLILGKGGLSEATYKTGSFVQNRWNLLSFDDSNLRHTPSAVFVSETQFDTDHLIVRDNFNRDVIELNTSGQGKSAAIVARELNSAAFANNQSGQTGWKIRAYPANNGTVDGVVIVGDEDFEIAVPGLVSAAGQALFDGTSAVVSSGSVNFKITRMDEYLLAFRLNEGLFAAGAPATKRVSVQMAVPGGSGTLSIDLSAASGYADAYSAFSSAISAVGDGVSRKAVAIDTDFDGINETVFVAASKRFYMRDNTHMRLFDYNDSYSGESFLVQGVAQAAITYGATMADTVSNINTYVTSTRVLAHEVNATQKRIVLTSIEKRDFDLKERGKRTQFTDLPLGNESNLTLLGAVDEVYSPLALASVAVDDMGTPYRPAVMTNDMTFAAQWSPDFPLYGPLYALRKAAGGTSSGEMIVGGVTREDKTILWRQADLTIPAYQWKTSSSRFSLFKLHKERGYWVYMRSSGATENVGASSKTLSGTVTRHYANLFDAEGSNALAPTTNHIDLTVDITAYGLEGLGVAAGEMPENVQLHVDGRVVPLVKNGGSFNYLATLSSHDTPALAERSSAMPKLGMGLYVADGRGSRSTYETLHFDNIKPDAPTFAFDSTGDGGYRGGLAIEAPGSKRIALYDGNLSDAGGNYLIWEGSINSGVNRFNLLDQYTIVYGTPTHPYYDLRLLGEGENKLQSDTRRIFYAPVYKGTHLISVNGALDGNETNATPIGFSYDGQSTYSVLDNNNLPTDGGVQLWADGDLIDSNTTVLTYQPIAGAALNACGMPDVINLVHPVTLANLGSIGYCSSYRNRVFYLYHQELAGLYYGVFPDTGGVTADYTLNVIDSNQSIVDPRS